MPDSRAYREPTASTAGSAEDVPADAAEVFGDRLPLAMRYAGLLVDQAPLRGLIGPREPSRIWSRHLLNCAAVTDVIPADAVVVDVGSGAGLPGLPVAIRRPDVRVRLVETQARRTVFLTEAVAELGLTDQVSVIRGRAEDAEVVGAVGAADVVTARAVAPLDRLVRWCLPLLAPGGRLALVRGASAADELAGYGRAIRRAGGSRARVVPCRAGTATVPVVVVERKEQ